MDASINPDKPKRVVITLDNDIEHLTLVAAAAQATVYYNPRLIGNLAKHIREISYPYKFEVSKRQATRLGNKLVRLAGDRVFEPGNLAVAMAAHLVGPTSNI